MNEKSIIQFMQEVRALYLKWQAVHSQLLLLEDRFLKFQLLYEEQVIERRYNHLIDSYTYYVKYHVS